MGTRERRDRQKAEVRRKILDAARELFAAEGYEAVTMRRIAERIEYSPTAIYGHFADKETLIRALCDADFGALAADLQAIARIPDPIERLRAAGTAYTEFGLSHPNHYRLMFMTPHPPLAPGESGLEHGNPEQDAYAFLRSTVTAAIAAGRLRPGLGDAEAVSQAVWAGVHGVVSLHIAKCNDGWVPWRPVRETARLVVDALIEGLRAPVPARTPAKRATAQAR